MVQKTNAVADVMVTLGIVNLNLYNHEKVPTDLRSNTGIQFLCIRTGNPKNDG